MQATGDLVGLVLELAAGVEKRHHRLQRRLPRARVRIDWDATTVVADSHVPITVDGDVDAVAEASHGLIYAIVDDFVDEVMETTLVGASNVHAGAASHRLQPFQHLNVARSILAKLSGHLLRLYQIRRYCERAGRVPPAAALAGWTALTSAGLPLRLY